MTRTTITLAVVTVFGMTACRDPMPCPDCDIAEDDNDDHDVSEDLPLPDLPCDGADLMTDSLNCGTCGNACVLYYDGTEYGAGTCSAGVCGPGWSSCTFNYETCADVCSAFGQTCVPNGCSGYTGLLFGVLFGEGCNANWYTPEAAMTGGCDEPIPWTPTGDYPREVMCCCDFQ